MASKIQFRRDTSNNWREINPILAAGEIGYIFEKEGQEYKPTNQYKLGDGVKPWNELPLFGFSGTFSESLEEIKNENPSTVVVSKRVLIDKFVSIEDSIALLASIESLEQLEEKVEGNTNNITTLQTTVEGNTNNITTLQTTVDGNTNNITTLQTTVDGHTTAIEKNITDISTNTTAIATNAAAITTLQSKHQVISKSDWNDGAYAVDDTFYYIYEDESN